MVFRGPVSEEHRRKISESMAGRRFPHQGKNPATGEQHGSAKLTKDDVKEIRELKSKGEKATEIADRFNITREHVHRICSEKYWKDSKR